MGLINLLMQIAMSLGHIAILRLACLVCLLEGNTVVPTSGEKKEFLLLLFILNAIFCRVQIAGCQVFCCGVLAFPYTHAHSTARLSLQICE